MNINFEVTGSTRAELMTRAKEYATEFYGERPFHFDRMEASPIVVKAGETPVLWRATVSAWEAGG